MNKSDYIRGIKYDDLDWIKKRIQRKISSRWVAIINARLYSLGIPEIKKP